MSFISPASDTNTGHVYWAQSALDGCLNLMLNGNFEPNKETYLAQYRAEPNTERPEPTPEPEPATTMVQEEAAGDALSDAQSRFALPMGIRNWHRLGGQHLALKVTATPP